MSLSLLQDKMGLLSMQQHNLSWLFSLALAALFAIPNATGRYRASMRPIVAFDIAVEQNVNRPPTLQLYYDKGKGFSEQHSVRVVLPEKGTPKKIQAHLPVIRLRALRLDYLNGPGRVVITNLRFLDPFGMSLETGFVPDQFTVNQTLDLQVKNNTLVAQSQPEADDPYIVLAFNPVLKASGEGKVGSSAVFGLKIFALMGICVEILFFIIGKSWFNDWLRMKISKNQTHRH